MRVIGESHTTGFKYFSHLRHSLSSLAYWVMHVRLSIVDSHVHIYDGYLAPLLYDIWGPFHKSSYERFLLYEFVEPVLNYRSNEFVALTNLCETGSRSLS